MKISMIDMTTRLQEILDEARRECEDETDEMLGSLAVRIVQLERELESARRVEEE